MESNLTRQASSGFASRAGLCADLYVKPWDRELRSALIDVYRSLAHRTVVDRKVLQLCVLACSVFVVFANGQNKSATAVRERVAKIVLERLFDGVGGGRRS